MACPRNCRQHPDPVIIMNLVGYRSDHNRWWDVTEHARHETDQLGNPFPDVAHLDGYEGIWVTHTEQAARRYGDTVYDIDLTGTVLIYEDGDDGYFYARPRTTTG